MRFERLFNQAHPMYPRAMALYAISFPPHEQREAGSQARILRDGDYHLCAIEDGDAFVGAIFYWEAEHFIYVEHFCIAPEMRNQKYGQKALELLGQQGKTVILEIDPPVDAISNRRKGFYERSGFVENPFPHVHPPYHRGNTGHDLVIMSAPRAIAQAEYDIFKEYLDLRVMKDAFS